ncbi:hypothetical protein EJ03DRAFT_163252 [Teratosphaeria nubilosa]|uniref:Uncharacterized protein n=1 Tax=Teratosphaeria nubilosa TaxID=161662 RepID=A0A6G1L3L5_9PEZI|nr:hypothetical protein EJ03DRAFT_163252 [Teratosphaeria nubilosa]
MTLKDLDLNVEDEEALDGILISIGTIQLRADASLVLDLPQLYTQPSAKTLLATLQDLSSAPPSWDTTPRRGNPRAVSGASTPLRKRRKIRSEGVPAYLTKIISSPLAWIEDDAEKERIWETASVRLSERSGRTAMGAITRAFAIPMNPVVVEDTNGERAIQDQPSAASEENLLEISLHEPALTADNLGLKTWASSYLLAKRMVLLKDTLPILPSDATILELGAGTGLVGLTAAAVLHRRVILTDLPEIVPNLATNATSNAALIASHGGSVRTAILDWSSPSTFSLPTTTATTKSYPRHTFPLILAADPIYSPEHPGLLVNAVAYHLSRAREARVVVEMPVREAYGVERRVFREGMGEVGLVVLGEGEEVGLDDWGGGGVEVRCWWCVWGWRG